MSSFRLRRGIAAMLLAAVIWPSPDPSPCAAGESWIFQRSYYSHQPANEVQVDKKVVTQGPVVTRPQGAYVRGGYRRLRVGGDLRCNDDYHYFYESWFQRGEQF